MDEIFFFSFQMHTFSLCDFESNLTEASLQMQRKNISQESLLNTSGKIFQKAFCFSILTALLQLTEITEHT